MSALMDDLDGGDGARRDRWGRYMIVPPGMDEPTAYRRATTVVKALDSEGGLAPWKQSRALLGIVRDPSLLKRLRAMVKAHPDPWYSTDERKKALKALISEAERAGGSDDSNIRGTDLHSLLAQLVRGEDLSGLSSESHEAQWLEGVTSALDREGIDLDPAWVETIVVHDKYAIAGTADYLLATVPGFPLPLVADLKTGSSLKYSLPGYCAQLAVYVTADACYIQGEAADGSQDRRMPMPERDMGSALIIHAPQDQPGVVEFHVVDVAAGVDAFELALDIETHRADPPGAVDIQTARFQIGQLAPEPEPAKPQTAPLKGIAAIRAHVQNPSGAVTRYLPGNRPSTSTGRPIETVEMPGQVDVEQAIRSTLQTRIDKLGKSARGRALLSAAWPSRMPSLRASTQHTNGQLAVIAALLDDVEQLVEAEKTARNILGAEPLHAE